MTNPRLAAAALLLSLAACNPGDNPPAQPTSPEAPPPTSSPSYSATPKPGEELPPSQTTEGPLPLEFRHVWAVEAKDCTADPGLTRIAIAPGAIRWYEGRSVVISAEAPHERAVSLQVDHTSEGQTSRETHVLAVDEAGTTLTYDRNGQTFTYRRCD